MNPTPTSAVTLPTHRSHACHSFWISRFLAIRASLSRSMAPHSDRLKPSLTSSIGAIGAWFSFPLRDGETIPDSSRNSKFPSPASRARVHILNSDRNGNRQNVQTARTLPPSRFPRESGLGWIRARLPAFRDSSIRSEGENDAQNVLWSEASTNRD
jgi:hypothetical protein